MMTAPDVLGVLSLDGDLDLAVLLPQLEAVRSVLAEAGYGSVLRDWLPTSLALADQAGREIDLHTLRTTATVAGTRRCRTVGAFTTRRRCAAPSPAGRSAA